MTIQDNVMRILEGLSGAPVEEETQLLTADLGLDSLNLVMLLLDLEETFQFHLEESDMNPFELNTVGDVIRLAERYVGGEDDG